MGTTNAERAAFQLSKPHLSIGGAKKLFSIVSTTNTKKQATIVLS